MDWRPANITNPAVGEQDVVMNTGAAQIIGTTNLSPGSLCSRPTAITSDPMDWQPADITDSTVDEQHLVDTGFIKCSTAEAASTTPSAASMQFLTAEQTELYEVLFSLFRRSLSKSCDVKGEDYCRDLFSGAIEPCKPCRDASFFGTARTVFPPHSIDCGFAGSYIQMPDLPNLPSLLVKTKASFASQPLGFVMSLKVLLCHSERHYLCNLLEHVNGIAFPAYQLVHVFESLVLCWRAVGHRGHLGQLLQVLSSLNLCQQTGKTNTRMIYERLFSIRLEIGDDECPEPDPPSDQQSVALNDLSLSAFQASTKLYRKESETSTEWSFRRFTESLEKRRRVHVASEARLQKPSHLPNSSWATFLRETWVNYSSPSLWFV
jgi:hypothetical protein